MQDAIGTVATQFFSLTEGGAEFRLSNGARLVSPQLAYETYGELNPARDNAVLLFHTLTGSQHAAGYNACVPEVGELWTEECHTGWWDDFVGPDKAVDTRRFFVICANYLGGCYGSTGPLSICLQTGEPYGASFPAISYADTVDAQVRLLDHLGIGRLHAAIGASTGGMACLSLATRYPDRVRIVIPIASGIAPTPLQLIYNFEQIYAIERDPAFMEGNYPPGDGPRHGLALARMNAHKSFVSLKAMQHRSRFDIEPQQEGGSWYRLSHPLESYMLHQGAKFVERFDANSYLRIVDGWQRFNLLKGTDAKDEGELFSRCQDQRYLVFSIDSDVCYYPEQQEEMTAILKQAGVPCMRITVHSEKGHDSFLLEPELFTPHLLYVLNSDSG